MSPVLPARTERYVRAGNQLPLILSKQEATPQCYLLFCLPRTRGEIRTLDPGLMSPVL